MRLVWSTVVLIALLVTLPARAGGANPAPASGDCSWKRSQEQDAIFRFLSTHDPRSTKIISFNHRTGVIGAWQFGCASGCGAWDLTPIPEDKIQFDLDFSGKPTLAVRKGDLVRILVTDTSPLAFTAEAGETAETVRPDLAAIQAAVLQIGSFFSGVVGEIGGKALEKTQKQKDLEVRITKASPGAFLLTPAERNSLPEKTRQELDRWEVLNLILGINESSKQLLEIIHELAIVPTAKKDAAAKASGLLADSIGNLRREAAEAQSYLQGIESCETSTVTLSDIVPGTSLVQTMTTHFNSFRDAVSAAGGVDYLCLSRLASLEKAVEIQLAGLAAEPDKAQKSRLDYERAMRRVEQALGSDAKCSSLQGSMGPLSRDLQDLFQKDPQAYLTSSQEVRAPLSTLSDGLLQYSKAAEELTTLVSKAEEVLGKRGAVLKEATSLQDLAAREDAYLKELGAAGQLSADERRESLVHGILEAPRSNTESIEIPWDKTRQGELKIGARAGIKDQLSLSHADPVSLKYDLAGLHRFAFSVDAGVIYGKITQPSWKAVDPAPLDPNKHLSVVTQTGEDRVAGDIALFINFKPLRALHGGRRKYDYPGFQIGAGGGSGSPSLLAGFTYQTGVLRWGAGWQWKKVKELARGQNEGDLVPDTDSIRVRNTFDNNWYLSLTISISDLPFFAAN